MAWGIHEPRHLCQGLLEPGPQRVGERFAFLLSHRARSSAPAVIWQCRTTAGANVPNRTPAWPARWCAWDRRDCGSPRTRQFEARRRSPGGAPQYVRRRGQGVVVHHSQRRIALPRPVVAGEHPEIAGLGSSPPRGRAPVPWFRRRRAWLSAAAPRASAATAV